MFRKLIYFFRWPILLFVFGMVLKYSGAYAICPWLDIPMHFVGGFVVANSFVLIFNYWEKIDLMKIKSKLIYILLIVSLVALITIFWEFWEFLMSRFIGSGWQGNLEDTMCDLFLGLLGGISLFVFKKIKI